MYLLDTVVLSELRKANRNSGVVAWFDGKQNYRSYSFQP